jgi:hypothetical protein
MQNRAKWLISAMVSRLAGPGVSVICGLFPVGVAFNKIGEARSNLPLRLMSQFSESGDADELEPVDGTLLVALTQSVGKRRYVDTRNNTNRGSMARGILALTLSAAVLAFLTFLEPCNCWHFTGIAVTSRSSSISSSLIPL